MLHPLDGLRVSGIVRGIPSTLISVLRSNKAVLNSSPELPLLFLFIQLVIAVVLLHAAALLTSRVEIPKFDLKTAQKLTPVTLVNVIGLVFNILCLRGVAASFFQVRFMRRPAARIAE